MKSKMRRFTWMLVLGAAICLGAPALAPVAAQDYDDDWGDGRDQYQWYNPADWFGNYDTVDADEYEYDYWEDDYDDYGDDDNHGYGYRYNDDNYYGSNQGYQYGNRGYDEYDYDYDYYTDDWYEENDFDEWYDD